MRQLLFAALIACTTSANDAMAQAPPRPRAVTLEDVFMLRDIGGDVDPFLERSPDGRSVAFFVRDIQPDQDDYAYSLVLVDVASGDSRVLADAGRFIFRTDGGYRSGLGVDRIARFSPDGAWIYYLAERGGRLNIRRVGVDGRDDEAVTDADGDVRSFQFVGEDLVFETATPRSVAETQARADARAGFRVDDTFRAAYSLSRVVHETADARHWVFNSHTGEISETEALPDAPTPDRASIRALDPASTVAEPALGVFYGDNDAARCAHALCAGALDGAWVVNVDGAETVIFQRREGHGRTVTALYLWSPNSGDVSVVRQAEERLFACGPSARSLVCFHESALEPRRLVAIDLADGDLQALYDPNPAWSALLMPRMERIDFTDAEGNQSYAHLVFPQNFRRGRRYPAIVVQYHSRGFLRGGVGNETPILPLSTLGYFVLSVERPEFLIRGARLDPSALQRETELDGSERRAKREALLTFIDVAVVRGVDRQRIAITGLSDGAETVYAMLMDDPDRFAAAVVGSPPTDPASWPLQASSYRDRSLQRIGLTSPWVEDSPWAQWWRENSASLHAERFTAPILFNWAEAEAIRGFPLLARLHERGASYETYIYPGAYHIKLRPQHIWAVQQRSLDWFDRWLEPND